MSETKTIDLPLTATDEQLSPVPLMQLASGFWAFKTLATAVELGLFAALSGGIALTKKEVGDSLGLDERPSDQLLAACASLGLLDTADGRYRNSALAERFLASSETSFAGFVRYLDQMEYRAWFDLPTALRTNRPVTWDPDQQDSLFATADPKMLQLFWSAMHSISSIDARQLDGVYDFTSHRRFLDIGGGTAPYPIHLCGQHPDLQATVLDLEQVREPAEAAIAAAGLQERVTFVTGDFINDALPDGFDVMLLGNILHDWDEPTGRAIVAKCRAALPPGGALLICELMLTPDRSGPPPAALMGLNMIVETKDGRNYSTSELMEWLRDAGFEQVQHLPMMAAGATGVLVATVGGAL